MDLLNKIKLIISDQIGKKEEAIKLNSSLKKDLGLDSLDFAELVISFEDKFSIEISDEEASNFIKVEDIFSCLKKKLGKKFV